MYIECLDLSSVDQRDLKLLEEIYIKILHQYENETFPSDQMCRFYQVLDLREQIHRMADALVRNNHFYLPFLFIPR
jgi:hypothetical protein